MFAKSIHIQNFRCIKELDTELSPGVNVIYGNNAQGKTSILEAMYIFARGRSYKTRKEAELIRFGEDFCRCSLEYSGLDGEEKMSVLYKKEGKKEMTVSGYGVNLTSEFIGRFRSVLFSPENTSLVKGGPSERRLFLNEAIAQINKGYVAELKRYQELLVQKNACLKGLKDGTIKDREIKDVYDGEMARYGAGVIQYRQKYARLLDGAVKGYFRDMTRGKENTKILYDTSIFRDGCEELDRNEIEHALYTKMKEGTEREIEQETSLYGPHKDDLMLLINGKSTRLYASQGQTKSLSMAMKLAEGDITRDITGEYPVYMLDDILGEIDGERQNFILSRLLDRQVIITSCLEREYSGCERVIRINEGRVV